MWPRLLFKDNSSSPGAHTIFPSCISAWSCGRLLSSLTKCVTTLWVPGSFFLVKTLRTIWKSWVRIVIWSCCIWEREGMLNLNFILYWTLLNFTELYSFFFFFLAMLFIKGFLVQLVWLDSVILENFAVWISVVTFLLFKKNLNCKE